MLHVNIYFLALNRATKLVSFADIWSQKKVIDELQLWPQLLLFILRGMSGYPYEYLYQIL